MGMCLHDGLDSVLVNERMRVKGSSGEEGRGLPFRSVTQGHVATGKVRQYRSREGSFLSEASSAHSTETHPSEPVHEMQVHVPASGCPVRPWQQFHEAFAAPSPQESLRKLLTDLPVFPAALVVSSSGCSRSRK